MDDNKPLEHDERQRLIEELEKKHCPEGRFMRNLLFIRKKYSWIIVVECARGLKRLLDILVSLLLIIMLSPIFLIISLLIKGLYGGPVIYVSERVGKMGKRLMLPKFTTMIPEAEQIKTQLYDKNVHAGGKIFKMKNDPRVTKLGRVLRKLSLDELPQLWSVLIGDMSLVGPRPPLPDEMKHFTQAERKKMNIKPGLTCYWQVSGRSDLPFEKQLELDKMYVQSQSFIGDIKILLKTIPAVIFGRGAY